MDLLRQVIVQTDFADHVKLAFQVIHVLFFVDKYFLEQLPRGKVADFGGVLNGRGQAGHGVQLERQIAFQLGLHVGADLDGADVGHIRRAIEKQDAVHQFFGVGHLGNGFLAVEVGQPQIAPILAHLGVQKVLVDGRQLSLENVIEMLDDLFVSAHAADCRQPCEIVLQLQVNMASRSINKVTLIGHLGRDAETKFTPAGVAITKFSIATSRRWKDQTSGEWKEETDWHNVVLWRAENLANYLLKGKQVYVEGRLQTRHYEDKEGKKVYITEVVAEDVLLLGGRGGEAGSGEGAPAPVSMPRSAPRQQAAAAAPDAGMDQGVSDDDVPF